MPFLHHPSFLRFLFPFLCSSSFQRQSLPIRESRSFHLATGAGINIAVAANLQIPSCSNHPFFSVLHRYQNCTSEIPLRGNCFLSDNCLFVMHCPLTTDFSNLAYLYHQFYSSLPMDLLFSARYGCLEMLRDTRSAAHHSRITKFISPCVMKR